MSKKVKLLLVLLLFVLIAPAFVFAQNYTTYAASSNLKNQVYKKTDTIFVFSNTNNFIWNRIMEESLQAEFKNKGITVFLLTDYMDITLSEDVDYEEILEAIAKTKAILLLEISIGDMYTFNVGKGISTVDIDAVVSSCSDFKTVIKIGLTTEADKNDWLSFAETRQPAIESTAKGLVAEYMKYVK